jgi:uncharacterized protein YbjT (DUF2867 family)
MTRTAGRVRSAGATEVVADVRVPASLRPALAGADVVVHLASSARDRRRTDVDGARNVMIAADGARVICLSIVGCDRTPLAYYRAKTAAEEAVRAAGGRVVRATQFHSLLRTVFAPRLLGRAVVPAGLRLQPVAEEFVSSVLVEGVADPTALPDEIGGPEQLDTAQIARRLTGRAPLTVPAPLPLVRAVRRGSLLAGPQARTGGSPLA